MENESILHLSIIGDQEAREERLIREIMAKDNISWEEAQPRFEEMVK